MHTWEFENGWFSDFQNPKSEANRTDFQVSTFPELNETPEFFRQENHLYTQMNFRELDEYIRELRQSGYGYDTVSWEIQLYRKFA